MSRIWCQPLVLAAFFLQADCIVVCADPGYPQYWARQFGTASSDKGFAIAVGSDGSVVVAGATTGNLGNQNSIGGKDAFLIKYDADGNQVWVRLHGTIADEEARGVFADEFGALFVTGYTQGNLAGLTNSGMQDVFLSKWNAGGVYHWTVLVGSPANDVGEDVMRVPDNARYWVTGRTEGNLNGEINNGSGDAFICGLTFDGNPPPLCRLLGTSGDDAAYGVAAGLGSQVLIVGRVMGSIGTEPYHGAADAFLASYSTVGSLLWLRTLGSTTSDEARELAVDSVTGEIYVVGVTDGNLDGETNNGGQDVFLAKYDTIGNHLWTRLFGSAADEQAFGIAVKNGTGVFVTGSTSGDLAGQTSAGAEDLFLAKFDLQGQHLWTRLLGTPRDDTGSDVAIDASGAVLVAGYSQGSLAGASAGDMDGVATKFFDPGAIPAISAWGLLALAIMCLACGTWVLKARRPTGKPVR